jgi:molecular chaperone HtpG
MTTTNTNSEDTFAFSADISQLMSLIINTMYSNKEIFLRELISNASDSLNKIRYLSLTESSQLDSDKDLMVQIIPNKSNKTLTIRDTGIGMTKSDLVNNLGTIAKSGTKGFMEAFSSGADITMIGQFGIGFYSAYLVADKVDVYSKHNSENEQHCWSSSASGSFTVKVDNDTEKISRGTRIVLHLKEDMKEYLEEKTLKDLVKKHSEFIDFPISLQVEKTKEETVDDIETVEELDDSSPKVEDITEKKQKVVKTVYNELELLNQQKPIWMKKKEDVSKDEYSSFYKSISNDWDDYLYNDQFSVEGQIEFKSVLFVPKKAPFNMFDDYNTKKSNIKLYVRRVFIMDDCTELIPQYLSFVKGIVDSEDLPLNISREILQENKILKVIKKNITKRCLQMFSDLSENKDDYKTFYEQFSKNIKLGVHEDAVNMSKIAKLLRYSSIQNQVEMISLDNYISNMPEGQDNIYYITGDSLDSVKNSPFLEKLKVKGYDVLFMVDPIDEYVMMRLTDYENKKFVSVTKEGLNFGETDSEKQKFEEDKKDTEKLCETMRDILSENIEKVVVSNRLSESPCCLVSSQYGLSANMERIMKAEVLRSNTGLGMNSSKKIMEINPSHPIIKALSNRINTDKESKSNKDLVWLLYDTTLLSSGFTNNNPVQFSNRILKLISLGLDVELSEDNTVLPVETSVEQVDNTTTESTMEQID